MAECSKCAVESHDAASPVTRTGWSRCAVCGGSVCLPGVVEPWLLLAGQWEGFTPRPICYGDWPQLQQRSCYTATDPMEQDSLQQGSHAHWVYPLSVFLMEVVGWCSSTVWSWLLGALALRGCTILNCVVSEGLSQELLFWVISKPVLVFWVCQNKVPQTEWLQQGKCIVSQFLRSEVVRVDSLWGPWWGICPMSLS